MTFNPSDWQWESLSGNWRDLDTLSPLYYEATKLVIRRKPVLKDGYYLMPGLLYVYHRTVQFAGAEPLWTVRGPNKTWTHSDFMSDELAAGGEGFTYLGNGDPDD